MRKTATGHDGKELSVQSPEEHIILPVHDLEKLSLVSTLCARDGVAIISVPNGAVIPTQTSEQDPLRESVIALRGPQKTMAISDACLFPFYLNDLSPLVTPPIYEARQTLALVGAGATAPFHWLHDFLPRLLETEAAGLTPQILVPNRKTSPPFIRESLILLGIDDDRIIDASPNETRFEQLLFVAISDEAFLRHAELLGTLRTRFLSAAFDGRGDPNEVPSRDIYISRQGLADRRSVTNHDDVVAELKNRHPALEIVAFEDLFLKDQIRIAAEAKLIFAPHGAGLFHTLFMKRGTVIELYPVKPIGEKGTLNAPCWDRILDCHRAQGREVQWYAIESEVQMVSSPDAKYDRFRIVADVPLLAEVLDGGHREGKCNEWHRVLRRG